MKNKKYMIAGISLAVLMVAGIAVGAYFLFKPKDTEEGCWFRGRIYQSGEEFKNSLDSSSCVCGNGQVNCNPGGEEENETKTVYLEDVNSNGEDEPESSNSNKPSNRNDPEKTTVKLSEDIEYVWYEDDYIKFKYPKGWSADVKSGKFVDPDQESDFDGLRGIMLTNEQDEIALSISGLFGAGLGGGGFQYKLNEPKKIYFDYPGDSTFYVLSEDAYRKESDKIDDLVISYFSYFWVDETYAYNFDEGKYFLQEQDSDFEVASVWGFGRYGEEDGDKIFYETFLWDQTELAKEPFITGTGKIFGETDKDILQNTDLLIFSELSPDSKEEFEQYVEVFGEFFESIDRK
jgi:hypothetical protein